MQYLINPFKPFGVSRYVLASAKAAIKDLVCSLGKQFVCICQLVKRVMMLANMSFTGDLLHLGSGQADVSVCSTWRPCVHAY